MFRRSYRDFIGNATQAPDAIPSCNICSKETKIITLYIKAKHNHVLANNFYIYLDTLLDNPKFNQHETEKRD
jgi:hypothetical protein